MKKVFVFALLLVFCAAASSFAWTGRMGGMGNPYGLVEDESDFLTHPTAITGGQGIRYYGDMNVNYTKVGKWDYSTGTGYSVSYGLEESLNFGLSNSYSSKGHNWDYSGSFGIAFPVNTGRMGVFFQYDGAQHKITGDQGINGSLVAYSYDTAISGGLNYGGSHSLKNDLDSFVLRVLYAQPFTDKVKFGGEFAIGYKYEKNRNNAQGALSAGMSTSEIEGGPSSASFIEAYGSFSNDPFVFPFNQFPFQIPFDSKYWEATLKASVEGKIGPSKLNFTPYFSFIFSGKNKYNFAHSGSFNAASIESDDGLDISGAYGSGSLFSDMNGKVSGWKIGADTWWRYDIAKGFSLPFVVKVEYGKKERDGNNFLGASGTFTEWEVIGEDIVEDGPYTGNLTIPIPLRYDHNEKYLNFLIGGGVDKEFGKGGRFAAGLYYNYYTSKTDFSIGGWIPPFGITLNYSDFPKIAEHKLVLNLAGEMAVAPTVTLRGGFNFFYGWLKQDYDIAIATALLPTSISTDGHRWGIGGAFGATFNFGNVLVEPYLKGGYQALKLSGDGTITAAPMSSFGLPIYTDMKKDQWNVGGGVSFRF